MTWLNSGPHPIVDEQAMKTRFAVFLAVSLAISSCSAMAQMSGVTSEEVNAIYPEIDALYLDLHQHPELAFHEQQTVAKLAERMKALGYEVTTDVGKTGIVAILRNGDGPTVMLRTDLDALPVEEKTGLAYASKVTTTDEAGLTVPVMHACGHDIHMSSWYGTAKLMTANKLQWHGTLVLVGQPAEEVLKGATAMLNDGLFTRFPKPNFALAVHDIHVLPAGQVGFRSGYAMASNDFVDITIFGKGGHAAFPQNTIDPIVIGARIVMALQTIVAREDDPLDPAVVTVGSFHGGTKHNVIPDEVKLQLTVRTYKPEVRKRVLASIERIAKGEAIAGGAPREPLVQIGGTNSAVYNDPELTNRLAAVLRTTIGTGNVVEVPPVMGAEDFSEFSQAGVPSMLLWVGAVEPAKFAAAKQSGTLLPGIHSPLWAPDREPTIKTAVVSEMAMLMELMGK